MASVHVAPTLRMLVARNPDWKDYATPLPTDLISSPAGARPAREAQGNLWLAEHQELPAIRTELIFEPPRRADVDAIATERSDIKSG